MVMATVAAEDGVKRALNASISESEEMIVGRWGSVGDRDGAFGIENSEIRKSCTVPCTAWTLTLQYRITVRWPLTPHMYTFLGLLPRKVWSSLSN